MGFICFASGSVRLLKLALGILCLELLIALFVTVNWFGIKIDYF